ncbi:hypothetical protein [Nocardia sp. NBC_01009]|uniref:hypothetical protein n=1 Tax=Nocardia sp. NBC_01009 TaxID=2975996 RepID=UPI003863D15D|nr:hypothetical protein OHA42_36230 [Nocardia sp. NBC_01009]
MWLAQFDRHPWSRSSQSLGYQPSISFTKHCANYRFTAAGREMAATIAKVPKIAGIFLELETLASEEDMAGALLNCGLCLPNSESHPIS